MTFKEKYGEWALITGASSGLGVEYAKQLAEKGLNIAIVARREELLEKLADEIRTTANVEVKVISLDLAQQGFFDKLQSQINGLDVGLVVNNAGINCEGDFYRGDLNRNLNMLHINVEAPFIIAYELGKKLVERGRGGIIFTSSSSAFQATPYLSHYGATKAYILSLAESMNYEFGSKGVDVIALCPGFTESEMTKGLKGSPLLMKAAPVVQTAIDNLGKKAYVVAGVGNKLQAFLTQRILGRDVSRKVTGNLMGRVFNRANKKKK